MKTYLCLASFLITNSLYANPVVQNVASGTVNITQTLNTTTINQASQQAIINWKSFNIGTHEKTQFIQPNTSAVALNRINPNLGASKIYGTLISNGKIILINGAGIYFGPNAMVNVGSIIASTSDISNANFLAGNYIFDQPSSFHGTILNEGKIKTADFGLVALMGKEIINNGYIEANLGNVVLATGNKFTVDFNGDELVNFTVDEAATRSGQITNKGSIIANGGKILLDAQAACHVLDNVINLGGVVQANTVAQKNGEIILMAKQDGIKVSGKVLATGKDGSDGGTITIVGKKIDIESSAVVNASGDNSGGFIQIGDSSITSYIDLNANSQIKAYANAVGGSGGLIDITGTKVFVGGMINAGGKASGSSGGIIDVAGKNIVIGSSAVLTVAGGFNGGIIGIGGNPNAASTNTNTITIKKGSVLTATSSDVDGSGGFISVYGNKTQVNGRLDASSSGMGSFGGIVEVLGKNIFIKRYATINATGDSTGGQVWIGGSIAGQGPLPNADTVSIAAGSLINVSALTAGLGGQVVVWANDTAAFGGTILAKGGATSGDGGLVSLTGLNKLYFYGNVDVSAPNGTAGTLLLNPEISGANVIFGQP